MDGQNKAAKTVNSAESCRTLWLQIKIDEFNLKKREFFLTQSKL